MAAVCTPSEIEHIISYIFQDGSFLDTALMVADRVDGAVSFDGNRGLAMLGDSLFKVVLQESCYTTGDGRAKAQNVLASVMGRQNLGEIAKRSKIDQFIKPSPRQSEWPLFPVILSNTMKAIVAATWLDSDKDWNVTCHVTRQLVGWGDALPPGFSSSAPRPLEDYSSFVNPDMPSSADASCQEQSNQTAPLTFHGTSQPSSTFDSSTGQGLGRTAEPQSRADGSDHAQHGTCLRKRRQADVDQRTREIENVDDTVDLGRQCTAGDADESNMASSSAQTAGLPRRPKQRKSSMSDEGRKADRSRRAVRGMGDLRDHVHNEVQKWHGRGPRRIRDLESIGTLISRFELGPCSTLVVKFYYGLASCEAIISAQNTLQSYRRGIPRDLCQRRGTLTNAQRFKMIECLDADMAYINLLRRCHTLELYTSISGASAKHTGGFVSYTPHSLSSGAQRVLGNPKNCAEADVTRRTLQEIFPGLNEKNPTYTAQYRRISRLREVGRRLYMLKNQFGLGILAMLSSETESLGSGVCLNIADYEILSLSDNAFARLLHLLEGQGEELRKFGAAAATIVDGVFNHSLDDSQRFRFEDATHEEILQKPKGSDELLELLEPVGSAGATEEPE